MIFRLRNLLIKENFMIGLIDFVQLDNNKYLVD